MNIRFHRDPQTGEPHIYGHDVDEDEVADVLESPGGIVLVERDRVLQSARPTPAVTSE